MQSFYQKVLRSILKFFGLALNSDLVLAEGDAEYYENLWQETKTEHDNAWQGMP